MTSLLTPWAADTRRADETHQADDACRTTETRQVAGTHRTAETQPAAGLQPSAGRRPPAGTQPAAVSGYRPGDGAYRRIRYGLMLGGLANFVALYYVQPLLPRVAEEFHVSAAASSAVLSLSTVTMAVAMLFVGPISDMVGRVTIMRVSLVGSAVLGIASAFAPTWHSLLVLRGLEGVALAGLPAVALAYLREEMHHGAHLRANATYITGTALGGAAGRLLPGPLDALWGWQGATLVVGGLTLACAGGLWVLVPPSRRFVRSSPRPGELLRTTRLTLRDPALVALFLVGAAGMGAFVGLYNAMAFRLEAAPYLLGGAAALVFLAYPVGVAAPLAAGRLAARLGRGRVALIGVALLLAGVLLTAPSPLPLIVAGLGVLTFAFLGTHSLVSGWVSDRAHRLGAGVGQASGLYLLAYYTGSSVFGTLATHRWQAGGWPAVIAVSAGLTVTAGVLVAVAHRFDTAPRPTGDGSAAARTTGDGSAAVRVTDPKPAGDGSAVRGGAPKPAGPESVGGGGTSLRAVLR
ncbi:YNFM family putative membrane transporter [Streptosporangium becharense]|uniref:YNFM family putative membrane transporter n=1 Tax=Streptosporangium becharense TaxID=1816182 RepID=A0A7W9IJ05_9ACTN|nr:MFS transporter [Streptosporangium becharense]MBB2911314.1 YNFM family putative membrane transporter [Streptosporangium becharense]MBB5821628.1 YNFM family putative membrane transporter [Streptosporangium becharense]